MIFDPDGEHAMTDDGQMAVRVYATLLDDRGFPTGEKHLLGWSVPGEFGPVVRKTFIGREDPEG